MQHCKNKPAVRRMQKTRQCQGFLIEMTVAQQDFDIDVSTFYTKTDSPTELAANFHKV